MLSYPFFIFYYEIEKRKTERTVYTRPQYTDILYQLVEQEYIE